MDHQALFQERVIRIEPSTKHYSFLTAADGGYLGILENGTTAVLTSGDDQVIWEATSDGFRHVKTGRLISARVNNKNCILFVDGKKIDAAGKPSDEAAIFQVTHGPEKLPSEYLRTLQQNGWVCLTSILSPGILEDLERVACTDRYRDRQYDTSCPALCQSSSVARTAAEPVSLWLLRQYMQIEDIRLGHSPAFAILSKDDGQRNVQGWHSDFPYHWGIPVEGRVPTHTGQTVLGVQRNVCVSDFTSEGGATAFKLGSHNRGKAPPSEWGIASDHYKPGYRAAHGLPYNGPDADIIEAPGGSIILYDSRTWHRAGINRTDHKRAAILQAMIPMYVMPKNDTSVDYKKFIHSSVYEELNQREKTEMQNLMVHYFIGPRGQYAISPDQELTNHIRANRESQNQDY